MDVLLVAPVEELFVVEIGMHLWEPQQQNTPNNSTFSS